MNAQGTPSMSVNSSPASKLQAKPQPKPDLSWWDLLPLMQEPQHTASIHWTPQGIITAHPTKPVILLYPHPPSTSEKGVFPPDRRIAESGHLQFSPASVLSVSGSGEHVFAYFPIANGANSGAWCIWVNMVVRDFGTAEQGQAIVNCWWLGDPRQRITDESGQSVRLPPLGPRVAFHTPTALLLSEDFALQLIYEPVTGNRQSVTLQAITASSLRKTLHASPRRPVSLDPYTGHVCTSASLGLAYSESSILIAMQTSLLPPPCLPLSESQAMGLAIPSTPFLTHANVDDWEYTGTESTIRLCEITVKSTERGWDMQTNPLSPIPLPASGCLNHLHFISKLPDVDAGMTIDGGHQTDRYLVVGLSEFGTYSTTPDTSLHVYSIAKRSTKANGIHEWEVTKSSSRTFEHRPVTAVSTLWPVSRTQPGIMASIPRLPSSDIQESGDEIRILQIPSLQDDERYSSVILHGPDIPSRLVVSPQGTQMVVQSLSNSKQLGFHSYPTRTHVSQATVFRDAILKAVLSSQDIYDITRFITSGDQEFKLNIIDSVWDVLDHETGGGGRARWSVDYLRALLLVDRSSTDTADKEIAEKRTKATIDLLSLLTARSAFVDSRGKETDGPYDPDSIWPLSNICSWVLEFTEKALLAASEYQNMVVEGNTSQNVDPLLFLLLHRPLMTAWIDSLSSTLQFLSHVQVPEGSNSDNKTLITQAISDSMEQSPVNFQLLVEALKGLDKDAPISFSEWRKGYRALRVPESLSKLLTDFVNRVVTPEIVSLLPLHVRMAGMSLVAFEQSTQERDIITKKPLIEGEWQTLGGKTTCRRCGGKTTVNNSSTITSHRWRLWEMSFDRCVCGGQWK